MKAIHNPSIGLRYWCAITLASIFGTNTGDYFAHNMHLGHVNGIPILLGLFAMVYFVERFDQWKHQVYYWLIIIIIRTAATNIGDFTAFDLRMNRYLLLGGLVLLLAIFAMSDRKMAIAPGTQAGLPQTTGKYWTAMLIAGTLGTVLGDICSHTIGNGLACIVLSVVLVAVLYLGRSLLTMPAYYWLAIAVVRTAGTAIGDWFAESPALNLGLPLSTILTGAAFVLTLLLWKEPRSNRATLAAV